MLTLHRPSNVDDPELLRGMLGAVARIADRLPVVFPIHPRTRKGIEALGVPLDAAKGMVLTEPLGYLEFLSLTSRARLVLTDSGGCRKRPRSWASPASPCARTPSGPSPSRRAPTSWWARTRM